MGVWQWSHPAKKLFPKFWLIFKWSTVPWDYVNGQNTWRRNLVLIFSRLSWTRSFWHTSLDTAVWITQGWLYTPGLVKIIDNLSDCKISAEAVIFMDLVWDDGDVFIAYLQPYEEES